MLIPGRGGHIGAGRNVLGSTVVMNGDTVPSTLTVSQRAGSLPATYTATEVISFEDGFVSADGDEFTTMFVDQTSTDPGTESGVSYGIDAKGYRYGFNGKENDNEIKGEGNEQDYGMRIYDPRIGRFLSENPLTQSYPWYTPYQFAGNTPIQAIDLDGGEEELTQFASALKHKVILQMDNVNSAKVRSAGQVRPYKPNWGARWKAWNESKPGTHTWAILSRIAFATVNDAKIAYTSAVDGKNHASGIDNGGVTDYKERVGAGLYTLSNFILPSEDGHGLTLGGDVIESAELTLFRKGNTGAFTELEVPMGLKDVKNAAERAGVGLKGVKLKIDRDVEKIAAQFPYLASASGNTITLFPKSFTNMETLVRTLGHERTHVMQYQLWGKNAPSDMVPAFEKAAYDIESTFRNYFKTNGKLK